jgi:hypothetical protein
VTAISAIAIANRMVRRALTAHPAAMAQRRWRSDDGGELPAYRVRGEAA